MQPPHLEVTGKTAPPPFLSRHFPHTEVSPLLFPPMSPSGLLKCFPERYSRSQPHKHSPEVHPASHGVCGGRGRPSTLPGPSCPLSPPGLKGSGARDVSPDPTRPVVSRHSFQLPLNTSPMAGATGWAPPCARPSPRGRAGTYRPCCQRHQHPGQERQVVPRVHPVPGGGQDERLEGGNHGGTLVAYPGTREGHGSTWLGFIAPATAAWLPPERARGTGDTGTSCLGPLTAAKGRVWRTKSPPALVFSLA